jgi:hypothetical protein
VAEADPDRAADASSCARCGSVAPKSLGDAARCQQRSTVALLSASTIRSGGRRSIDGVGVSCNMIAESDILAPMIADQS